MKNKIYCTPPSMTDAIEYIMLMMPPVSASASPILYTLLLTTKTFSSNITLYDKRGFIGPLLEIY